MFMYVYLAGFRGKQLQSGRKGGWWKCSIKNYTVQLTVRAPFPLTYPQGFQFRLALGSCAHGMTHNLELVAEM